MKRASGFLAVAAVALGACGGGPTGAAKAKKEQETGGLDLRRIVGTVKNPPDEFAVISKKPLEMPQDFAALPPPEPGARSTRVPDPVAEARETLLKGAGTKPATTRTSVSEAALLSASGASDPTIRRSLADEQAAYQDEQELYVLDSVFPALKRLRGEDTKDLVDPTSEYQRLNTVAATPEARAARNATIATIPGAAAPATTLPGGELSNATVPSAVPSPAPAAPALPPAAAGTDGDLIYIPQ